MDALVLLNIFDSCFTLIRLSFLICAKTKSKILSDCSGLFRIVPLIVSYCSAIVPHCFSEGVAEPT